MNKPEFMNKACDEIDSILMAQTNRIMNIVNQAWAEGKKNAETETLTGIINDALEKSNLTNYLWIPVRMRLPEESGSYLATMSDGSVEIRYFEFPEKEWDGFKEVVAWMEKPLPYTE